MAKEKKPYKPAILPNIGWLFYIDYYKNPARSKDGISFSGLSKKNEAFSNTPVRLSYYEPEQHRLQHLKPEDYFELTTTYPGLLIGSGYQHETGSEDEFKLGFFFDHTSGLPIIPGSSIKGVLRSAFKNAGYIRHLLLTINNDLWEEMSPDRISFLEKEIFDGFTETGKFLPMLKRDIFHDAIPIISESKFQNGSTGKLFDKDYITPHINRKRPELSPFSNPIPLQFLKVSPKVTFCFQFDLKESTLYPAITKVVKMEIFKRIILDFGVGAKTNVGYGQFDKR